MRDKRGRDSESQLYICSRRRFEMLLFFVILFQRNYLEKYELSAEQTIHMISQDLYCLQKIKKESACYNFC